MLADAFESALVSSALYSTFSDSGGRTIHLENELMDVNVIPVPEPVVHISGTSDISREYEDFKLGVRIFADVHIVMTTGSPTGNGNFNHQMQNAFFRFMVEIITKFWSIFDFWTSIFSVKNQI